MQPLAVFSVITCFQPLRVKVEKSCVVRILRIHRRPSCVTIGPTLRISADAEPSCECRTMYNVYLM